MARTTKSAARGGTLSRADNRAPSSDPDWLYYERIRGWLEKLSKRDPRFGYSTAERAAVARVFAARSLFEEWAGYSVSAELITAAARYIADFSYEDELFVKELQSRNCTMLRLDDMRQLVGICPSLWHRHSEIQTGH